MSRQMTLIGRLGPIHYQEPPGGSAHASFDIIIARGPSTTPVPCEAWGILAEQAFSMDEGSLIGLIGTLTIDRTVRIETIEHLGRPL